MTVSPQENLTSPAYWDREWTSGSQKTFAELAWLRRDYASLAIDHVLRARLRPDPARRVLEVGCAPGRWLVYFQRTFGYAVTGCDYSERGCLSTRETLAAAGISGDVFQRDLFTLEGQWDVVFSAGLIEHFTDPKAVLTKFLTLLPAHGMLVSLVPNLAGLSGFYHRAFKPETFHTHRVVTLDELRRWYDELGLREVESGALGSIVPSRFPRSKLRGEHPRLYPFLWRPFLGPVTWVTNRACTWALQHNGLKVDSPRFSPYLYAIGRRG